MANRTVRDAHTIHGTNPQNLIEKVIRYRIYDSKYWKEECFGLNAALLVDKACELRYIGGVVGATNVPTPFLCLVQKLLQIQPDKDVVIEFIRQNDFKYARALGAMYLRLTGNSVDIFKYLETLYNDYSKLRRQNEYGEFVLTHMDEFIEELLKSDRVSSITLPRVQKRYLLEEQNLLEPRISILDEDLQETMLAEFEKEAQREAEAAELKRIEQQKLQEQDENKRKSRSRSRSRGKRRKRSEEKKDRKDRGDRKHRHRVAEEQPRDRDRERHHRDRERDHQNNDDRHYRDRDRDKRSPEHEDRHRDRDRRSPDHEDRHRDRRSPPDRHYRDRGDRRAQDDQDRHYRDKNRDRY